MSDEPNPSSPLSPGGFIAASGCERGPCLHPWADMWVNARGLVSCCPQNRSFFGDIHDAEPEELWNGAPAQRVREQIARGDYEAAGCEAQCPFLRGSFDPPSSSPPSPELINPDFDWSTRDDTYGHNVRRVAEDYRERRTQCEGLPLFVDMQPVLRCNLDCIMCGQPHDSPLVHDALVWRKLDRLASTANHFRWQGGEVFLDRGFRSYLHERRESLPEHLHLGVITNGTVLGPDALNALASGDKPVHFLLSMDGVRRETFSRVRLGAKYERVVHTLERLAQRQREDGRRLVTWNYVVMRTTLDDMDLAIEWARRLDVELNFAAIQGDHGNENVFANASATERDELARQFQSLAATAQRLGVAVSGFDGLLARIRQPPKRRLPVLAATG